MITLIAVVCGIPISAYRGRRRKRSVCRTWLEWDGMNSERDTNETGRDSYSIHNHWNDW